MTNRYWVRADDALIHIAEKIVTRGNGGSDLARVVLATLCDIEVNKEWKTYSTPTIVSCLQCIAREDD